MTLVKHVLEAARKRLAVLNREASLFDVARILANLDTPLVVVCDSDGIAVGVVSSSHVINILATSGVDALSFNAGAIMTKPLLTCHADETLQQVWAVMNSRILPCAPVLDDVGRAPRRLARARCRDRAPRRGQL
jgi:CBS domain-containing protein